MRSSAIAFQSELAPPSSSAKEGRPPRKPTPTTSWRSAAKYFQPPIYTLPRGVLNFSPAWFMQGREASSNRASLLSFADHPSQGHLEGLATSPALNKVCGAKWMTDFQIAGALISGILRIAHPDQYRMGYQTLQHLAEISQVASTVQKWPTVFHAVTLICNRSSPLHK